MCTMWDWTLKSMPRANAENCSFTPFRLILCSSENITCNLSIYPTLILNQYFHSVSFCCCCCCWWCVWVLLVRKFHFRYCSINSHTVCGIVEWIVMEWLYHATHTHTSYNFYLAESLISVHIPYIYIIYVFFRSD